MKRVIAFLSLSVLALAGCGGSNSAASSVAPVSVGAAETSMGAVPSTVTLDFDEVTDVLTLTDGTTTVAMAADDEFDVPGFTGYYGFASSDNFGNLGETSSGSGRVATISSPDEDLEVAGTFLERVGETLVPLTGTATHTGNYVAYVSDALTLTAVFLVTGGAELNVDFADASVDGTITDRTTVFTNENLADLVLQKGSIDAGAFSGTTIGGEFEGSSSRVAPGDYVGLLTGADAEEAVAGVQINHNVSGTSLVETGAFVVE